MKDKIRKKPKWFIFVPIICVLVVLGIVADIVCAVYWDVIAAAFTDTEDATDYDLLVEAIGESEDINTELLEEGAVLLKNDDILPLDGVSAVNTYGVVAAHVYPNGSGSGSISSSDDSVVSLKDALSGVGIDVNDTLWTLEEDTKVSGSSSSVSSANLPNELSVSEYASAVSWSDAKAYSDYAIFVVGRMFSEGSDADSGDLELSSNELALLKQLDSAGFKVITLVNSSNVIELGPVVEYSDAILWIGGPGTTGLSGVANILAGEVSPSGRLVDTWMYAQETDSAYYTAQTYNYYNESGTSIGGYTNYNEGIYVGYRWYETADSEGYWDGKTDSNAPSGASGYEAVVAYPFGYGLSYGEFTEEITNVEHENGQFVFTVSAENASSVSSKTVFELYVEKPYTEGGVEVSKVELCGFAKSGELTAADGAYTAEITVKEEDLASYDETAADGAGAYVLAGGNYTFYLASGETGAHIWKDYEDGTPSAGSLSSDGRCYVSTSLSETVYSGDNGRSSDEVAASNRLSAEDNILAIDDDNAGYTALSRADGFANASKTIGSQASKVTLSSDSVMYEHLTDSTVKTDYGDYQGEVLDNLLTEQKQVYTLSDLYTEDEDGNALFEYDYDTDTKTIYEGASVDFDDSRWETLIAQMSTDEMQTLICRGGWQTAKVESIGKEKGVDYDGPFGLNNYMQSSLGIVSNCTSFCSEPVVAATWNEELVEAFGAAVGKEANATGQSGWYAPGANIHRSSYGGRNAEYYSEDAFLSGTMCAAESSGAHSVGLYCVAKHFAFNDIEANRTSMENCWMSEQTAREIYLRPFEMGVKDGGVTALMTSYMWICGDWSGANYNYMTGIVREEWGFQGMITTDNATSVSAWITPARMIYAGGDMILNQQTTVKLPDAVKTSDEGLSAMKVAVHHILYTVADASLYRIREAKVGSNTFIPIFVAANVVLYGAAVAVAIVYLVKVLLYRKNPKTGVEAEPDEKRTE